MSAEKLEAFLAKLYVDEKARSAFLTDPRGEALNAGLSDKDSAALGMIDRVGLELAATSFARERHLHPPKKLQRRTLTSWFKRR